MPCDPINVAASLQASVAPVTMISAIGFLMLVTSNRFSRVVDRMRVLLAELPSITGEKEKEIHIRETHILYRRSKNLCFAAFMGGACIFFIGLTIFMLFAKSMFCWGIANVIAEYSFLLSLLLLLFFAIIFAHDFAVTQHAVRFELDQHLHSTQPVPKTNVYKTDVE